METGKALAIVHNMARRHFDSVGDVPTDKEAKNALNTVEDFIVNNFGEENEKHPKMQTLEFIAASDLVPKSLVDSEFWGVVSEDAPFSFGDNNRTLITASRLADHCDDRICDNDDFDTDEVNKFIAELRELGETYIDLEN